MRLKQIIRRNNQRDSSKNPKLFGIDIHIDDAIGVRVEGEKYNFKTIIISVENNNWVSDIIESIDSDKANNY